MSRNGPEHSHLISGLVIFFKKYFFVVCLCVFELTLGLGWTRIHHIAQVSFELMVALLPWSPIC